MEVFADATAEANVAELELIIPALKAIPEAIDIPSNVPLIADKAYDSDPLRKKLTQAGFRLLSPHRRNRAKSASNDGRRMRWYRRR